MGSFEQVYLAVRGQIKRLINDAKVFNCLFGHEYEFRVPGSGFRVELAGNLSILNTKSTNPMTYFVLFVLFRVVRGSLSSLEKHDPRITRNNTNNTKHAADLNLRT